MGIDAVVLHVDLGPGDKERTGLMDHIKSLEINITAIHDVDGAGLGCDQIEGQGITHLPSEIWIKLGIGPRRSSSVCILTAAFVERKSAHGNSERHKSIVVLSSA